MSEQPYMPFWIGKFVADTMHLSAEETGAYVMLLGAMWMRGGTLLPDQEGLCRIARVSPKRWSRIWKIIEPFFTVLDGGLLTQKRLAHEYQRASDKRLSNSQKATSGWKKRRASDKGDVTNQNNELDNAAALPGHCSGNVSHTHTHKHKENRVVEDDDDLEIPPHLDRRFAWQGKVIRLSKRDLDQWQASYPRLDLLGELLARDQWLADQPTEVRAKWFQSTSKYLANRNMEAKAKGEVAAKPPPERLSRTQVAINKLREKHGTGFSGSEICDGGGELSPVLISTTSAEPGGLRGSTDSPLRRPPEITLAPDGEPG